MRPTTRTAEVRAAHLQALVATLPALGDDVAQRVRERARRAIDRIGEARRLAFLHAQLLVDLCEAVEAVAGHDALERWGASVLDVVVEQPLVRAFYEVAMALDRRDPRLLLSHLTQAWRLLYSGCGDLSVASAEPGCVRLVQYAVPEILRREATVLPLVGALGSIPSHCGYVGTATAEWTPESPRFAYVIRWAKRPR